MSLGPAEILVVLVIALLVFGPKKLPEVGRQVGGALRELRKVQDTVQNEIRTVFDDVVAPTPTPPPRPLPTVEPDLGDEARTAAPTDSAVSAAPDAADDPGGGGIDGLSGGTFS